MSPFSILHSPFRRATCAALAVLGAGACAAVAKTTTTAPAADRPNIIVILTDDQGWYETGFNGNPHIKTPVLDRLAGQGVSLTRFYACPVCTPTRAGLMTGRHYQRTGAIDTYRGRDQMRPDEVTLAQLLRGRGYRTGLVGKWHLGRYAQAHPLARGFDEFFGFWQYGFINRYDDPDELFAGRTPVTCTGYVTDVLTDAALEFVRHPDRRPFFLYLAYNAPHSPHIVPDKLLKPYLEAGLPLTDARIYAMITSLDAQIGRLLEEIEKRGETQRTLVVFMGDNGGTSSYWTGGLRGHKGGVYEGGIRVPLLARWPGRIPAGVQVATPTQHVDLFATLCEVAGAAVPADRVIDGRSLMPMLTGRSTEPTHEYLFHQWNRTCPNARESWAVHRGSMKLANGQLFDLASDPGEKRDLAAEQPAVATQLRSAFQAWFADVTTGLNCDPPPIQIGRADENPVEIDVTWGRPTGKVKPEYRHYNRDTIEDWSNVQDTVSWPIEVTAAGRYEVTLVYGCTPGDEGGVIELAVGPAAVRHTIKPTAARDVYRPLMIGSLELPAGPTTLIARPVSIPGRELLALHKILLCRAE